MGQRNSGVVTFQPLCIKFLGKVKVDVLVIYKDTDLKRAFSEEIDASLCPCPGCLCDSVRLVPCPSYQDTIMSQHSY